MSKIGVFDSGIGGLSVLGELIKHFPENYFIYLADEGYFPYGTKTKEQIIKRGERIVSFFERERVDLIVVACNTISAVGLTHLKRRYKTPVIGVIDGAVERAVSKTKTGRIGVISTPLTANSHIYRERILLKLPKAEVREVGSQELVNIVEDGRLETSPVYQMAERILSPLKDADTLILGCTHFPPLEEIIKRILPSTQIVDPGKEIVFKLKEFIRCNSRKELKFYTTGDETSFKNKASVFIKNFNFKVEKVKL